MATIPASLDHHNHRFRIDFESDEAASQTERKHPRRQEWSATDGRPAKTAEQNSDDYLLAILDLEPARPRKAGLAGWLSACAISAVVNGSICLILALAAGSAPRERTTLALVGGADLPRPELTIVAPMAAPPNELLAKPSLAALAATSVQSAGELPALRPLEPGLAPIESDARRGTFDSAVELVAALGDGEFLAATGAAEDGPGAEFYGVKASGRKFVFVVDSSRSMHGPRWEAAVRELLRAVSRLQEGQFFYVIFFDALPHPMFDQPASEASFFAVEKRHIDRLRQWATSMTLGPDTEPLAAIKIACRLRPDAIYLLSDGEFRDKTALYLRRNNHARDENGRKTPAFAVHTIALQSRQGQPLLERIAKENAGEFRFIE
jgi:hypothetical protein